MEATEFLDSNNNIAILGDRNTAKTNLLFWLAKTYKGKRQIIFYGYPKDMGYKQIYSLQELAMTTNSVIMMDELQRHIKIYSNTTNETFLEVLSTMVHNGNTLVFTTPLTQAITKATDSFIDSFIYTRISDMGSLKNGSKAKRWLLENSFIEITKWSVNVPLGQFLVISGGLKGIFGFGDMGIGKDWTISQNFPKINPKDFPKQNERKKA